MKLAPISALLLSACALLPLTSRAADYDETVNGDLSTDPINPTPVSVAPGWNSIAGGFTYSYEFATITIPSGYAMTSLKIDYLVNSGASLLAISPGKTAPMSAPFGRDSDIAGMMGYILFRSSSAGPNILSVMGQGAGAIGFKDSLPAGSYSFWIQDYNSDVITYKYSFFLEAAVPPVVTVTTKKIFQNKVVLKGTASGTGSRVTYRLGAKGAFKRAGGSAPQFTFTVPKLKPGRNIVTIQAQNIFGTTSSRVVVALKK